jgi:hypothetical protein
MAFQTKYCPNCATTFNTARHRRSPLAVSHGQTGLHFFAAAATAPSCSPAEYVPATAATKAPVGNIGKQPGSRDGRKRCSRQPVPLPSPCQSVSQQLWAPHCRGPTRDALCIPCFQRCSRRGCFVGIHYQPLEDTSKSDIFCPKPSNSLSATSAATAALVCSWSPTCTWPGNPACQSSQLILGAN